MKDAIRVFDETGREVFSYTPDGQRIAWTEQSAAEWRSPERARARAERKVRLMDNLRRMQAEHPEARNHGFEPNENGGLCRNCRLSALLHLHLSGDETYDDVMARAAQLVVYGIEKRDARENAE